LPDILRIAASDDPTVRTKALMFFLQTLPRYYYDYDPYDFRDLAFIPAILGSEKIMVKPLDVRGLPHHDFPSILTDPARCTLVLNGQN
jgi:hypothetical protein